MDIIIFTILLIFSLLLGGVGIALPDRPIPYKVLAIFMAAFGSLLAALSMVQLISDGTLVIGSSSNSIYPVAYVLFFTMVFDAIASVSKIV